MSYEYNKEQLVDNYLSQVKRKLPGWLKEDRNEVQDILTELEEHIWDKAEDISDGEITVDVVRKTILEMGTPNAIAKEYKKRGTPKIFISEELWPFYVIIIQIVIAIVAFANLIGFGFGIFQIGFLRALEDLFTGLWGGFMGTVFVVSIIFVVLSMEGFLPEDFKNMAEKDKVKKTEKKLRQSDRQPHKEYKISEHKGKKIKPPIKISELLWGGIFNVIFGMLLISQPFPVMNEALGDVFLTWLSVSGIFQVLGGIILLIRALIGPRAISGQIVLMGVNMVKELAFIPMLLQVGVALTSITGLSQLPVEVQSVLLGIFAWIPLLSIFGTIVEAGSTIYKMIFYKGRYNRYLKSQQELYSTN